jgi:energy-coupling factor transporter ATP-binding protein EcfA2
MTARIDRVALIGWRGCGYLELEMDKGTLTGLTGGSGAGKSTIAMCLCFALLPDNRTLNVQPISEVEDSHKAGMDPLSARIDPLIGFGYVVLDITASNGERIVAGIHVRIEDGRALITRFNLENPPKDRRLQDFLRIVEADEEIYPDFGMLRTSLAEGGLTMRELRTVNEYGELLYNAGILPCDLKDQSDRMLYARLLESAFRGGLSRDVATKLKEYMLPPATRIPESVDRLQRCADTVLRTQSALNESQRQLRLLETTFGLGKTVVTRAIQDVSDRISSATNQRQKLMIESESLRTTLKSFEESIPLAEDAIEATGMARKSVLDTHITSIDTCQADQRYWANQQITRAQASKTAADNLKKFERGMQIWKRLSGADWRDHDREGLLNRLNSTRIKYLRDIEVLKIEETAKIERRSHLRAGVRVTNAAPLGNALGARTLAEELDQATGEEALSLEMALFGLVDGVVGVALEALAALPDSGAYPDTFWLSNKLPEPSQVHKVGEWNALVAPGGYLVTSSRRKLTLGRQARENELKAIEVRLEEIIKKLLNLGDAERTTGKLRDDLLKADDDVSHYFTHRLHEGELRDAADEAKAKEGEAQEKLNAAVSSVSLAIATRDAKIQELDTQRAAMQQSLQESKRNHQSAQGALVDKARLYEDHGNILDFASGQLATIRADLDDAFEWMANEAANLTQIHHDLYIAQQARNIAALGKELEEEPAERLSWLASIEAMDPVSCCKLWRPLRTIVSERISVDTLDQDSVDLIATMASRRSALANELERNRTEMRAEAGTLYNVISGEVRKQESRIKKISLFGEKLQFGNVTGMRIRPSQREDLLTHLMNITKQIDLFASKNDTPLQDQLAELFTKVLKIKVDGSALLDYRTYIDLTIEARRLGKWEQASGLSGGESIGGGLAVALMLSRSLSQRPGDGRVRPYTPFFVMDEVQRLNGAGQAVIVEFGRKQGVQVLVTAIALEPTYDCTIYVLDRVLTPFEEIVLRRITIDSTLANRSTGHSMAAELSETLIELNTSIDSAGGSNA